VDDDDIRLVEQGVEQLTQLVTGRLHLFTSRGQWAARQYGVAGLARGTDLLSAGIASSKAGFPDVVGVLVRSLVDSWLSGAYVMFGGAEALARLEHQLQRHEAAMLSQNGLGAQELLRMRSDDLAVAARDIGLLDDADDASALGRITTERIAAELSELLPGEDALALYNLLYRTYSTTDAHGLGPLNRWPATENIELIRLHEPTPWVDPHGSLGLATLLLCRLAEWVFDAFHLSTTEVRQVFDLVAPVLERAGTAAIAAASPEVLAALPADFQVLGQGIDPSTDHGTARAAPK